MVIFHHNDLNGQCFVTVVQDDYAYRKGSLKTISLPNHELKLNFKDHIKNDTFVYIVNFHFSSDKMRELFNITNNVMWIDHHRNIINRKNAESSFLYQ